MGGGVGVRWSVNGLDGQYLLGSEGDAGFMTPATPEPFPLNRSKYCPSNLSLYGADTVGLHARVGLA